MRDELGGLRVPPGSEPDYFVEWRPRQWGPVVGVGLGALGPLQGKRVLELGPRSGRMASLLAFNGAEVLGADLEGTDLSDAAAETERWGVSDRVQLVTYSGKPEDLPLGPFDAVFSKSVLVVVPNLDKFFAALADRLVPGGKLVCVENQRGGQIMRLVRKARGHHWADRDEFSGVGPEFMASLRQSFPGARVIRSTPLVCAIEAPAPSN